MDELCCIDCGAELRHQPGPPPSLACIGCPRTFPLIDGRIPLLVREPQAYLGRLHLQHAHRLRREAQRADALERRAAETPGRSETLLTLARALRSNASLTERAQRALRPHLSVDDVVEALAEPEFIGYANTLEYLERDWCGLSSGERELELILEQLDDALSPLEPGAGPVLVLGAGAGRVAWELRRRFDRVIALDASMTMAQHFHAVLDDAVSFHSIATSSMEADTQMVVPRITVGPPDRQGRDRVSYVVADASHVPLGESSMAAIVSVYFSDVMPLRHYFGEIVRLLGPGGRFVHFGPLEYHFDDLADHLSAAQFRRVFTDAGFELSVDRRVTSDHLSRAGSMASRRFDNWSLCAIKSNEPPSAMSPELDPRATLAVAEPLEYRACGSFSSGGHRRGEVELKVGEGACFRVSSVVIDVLEQCSAGATVAEIAERSSSSEHGVTAASVLRIINQLCRVGALQVRREG